MADRNGLLENALRPLLRQSSDTFYWITAESRRVRGMRTWLNQKRVMLKDWVKAKGYCKPDATRVYDPA